MLEIEFKLQSGDHLKLPFEIESHSAAQRWRALLGRIDTADFYEQRFGWGALPDIATALNTTLAKLDGLVPNRINVSPVDINTPMDYINYLHDRFVALKAWPNDNEDITQALNELNVLIHSFESTHTGHFPTINVLFPEPNNERLVLSASELERCYHHYDFGGLYLNYSIIGKSLSALAKTNDVNVAKFAPHSHFTADMVLVCYQDQAVNGHERRTKLCEAYFERHRKHFTDLGYESASDVRLRPGLIRVGKLSHAHDPSALQRTLVNATVSAITL